MRKLTFALFTVVMTGGATYAQTDKLLLEAQRKTILEARKKADEAITKKDSVKAKTWLTRAEAYLDLANSQDAELTNQVPDAAFTAVASLKKAISLDVKDGKEGSVAAAAKKFLDVTYSKEGKAEGDGLKLYGAFMNAGIAKYQAKDYVGALKDLQMASQVSSKDTTAAMYTGIIGQMAKDESAAKTGFEKFIALGGKDPGIFYSLTQIYKDEKNEEKALATLEKGIQLHPENKDLKNEKINLYLAFKKIDLAIADLQSVVNKDPSNVQTVLNLAILFDNKAEQYNAEIREIKDKLAENDTEGVKKKIAAQKDKVDAFESEIKRLTDKIKKDPKSAVATKKQIAEITKQRDAEKAELENLNGELAKKASASGNVAELTAKLNELQEKQKAAKAQALVNYDKALKADPNNYDVNYNLGVIAFNEAVVLNKKVGDMAMDEYKKDGKAAEATRDAKFKEALNFFEKAYSIKKEDEVKENLKQLYRVLKMEDKLKELGE
jgi:tetratricopeptide (TPR) repeat protein